MRSWLDFDGRLHIAGTPLTKANVSPYRGHEIPDWERLGLDRNKVYRLLRHPDALQRGVETFKGVPLLSDHIAHGSALDANLVVGTIGSRVKFADPYVTGDVVIWAGDAIRDIESGRKASLSCSYRYTPEMRAGTWGGVKYDEIMRSIEAANVALVQSSRVGRDMTLPVRRAA